jgi:hypothetical protein
VTSDSYTFVYNSDASRHVYSLDVTITTTDGEEYEFTRPLTLNEDTINPFPTSYPDWFKQAIVSIVAILFILGFSSFRADVGCLGAAGIFGAAYLFDWFPLSLTALFGIILIAMAAAIKFKRSRTGCIKMNTLLKDYLIFIIMFNFALSFVAATGVFPIKMEVAGLNVYDDIESRINNLQSKFTSASNTFEYMVVVGSLIINAFALIFDFIVVIVGGLPLVLLAAGVPAVFVGIIVSPVLILVFFELVDNMSRSG